MPTKKQIKKPTYSPMKECRVSHDNDHDHDHEDEVSWDVDEDEALWDVDNEGEALLDDNDSYDEGDESLWDHNDDDDSDDAQISPPPPAPNIPKNPYRMHDMFSEYQQKAEVSIAQKPAHRKQAPQAKFKGKHSQQAITVETPLRDGRVKRCFVQSEQRKALNCHVSKLWPVKSGHMGLNVYDSKIL
jgi:hypothetical protein